MAKPTGRSRTRTRGLRSGRDCDPPDARGSLSGVLRSTSTCLGTMTVFRHVVLRLTSNRRADRSVGSRDARQSHGARPRGMARGSPGERVGRSALLVDAHRRVIGRAVVGTAVEIACTGLTQGGRRSTSERRFVKNVANKTHGADARVEAGEAGFALFGQRRARAGLVAAEQGILARAELFSFADLVASAFVIG